MKCLFWTGLAIVLLGVASFFIRVPQTPRQSLNTGSISVGVNNQQRGDLSPVIGAVFVIGGLALMVSGCRERRH
jgi:hypothetical protein